MIWACSSGVILFSLSSLEIALIHSIEVPHHTIIELSLVNMGSTISEYCSFTSNGIIAEVSQNFIKLVAVFSFFD